MAATALRWQPLLPRPPNIQRPRRQMVGGVQLKAFRRRDNDMDNFAKRMASGEAWRDAWRSANDGFERFLFEAKKTAERIDRRYAVSQRLTSVAKSSADRAREIDRDFEIGPRWRALTMDFRRNWPKYKMQLNSFLDSPLGRSFAKIFFIWFALSSWLFRFLIIATWVLPFAGPLLIGTLANSLVIKAEVLSGLRFKLNNSPPNRYACLVAEPATNDPDSPKQLVGVIDVIVLTLKRPKCASASPC